MHFARCLLGLPLVLASLTATALADVTLPAVFTDHMVLQRDQPVPVWGWADPSEEITVSFRDQSKTATADAEGRWSVKLDALSLGEPGTLTVKGSLPTGIAPAVHPQTPQGAVVVERDLDVVDLVAGVCGGE